MKQATCLLALLCLALARAATPQPVTGTQVSSGYSNLATAQLLKAGERCSTALSGAGLIPAESLSGATVALEGQSTHAGGRVRAAVCEYWFRNGALHAIRRADLFQDKGPESLILRHLTNEVLILTMQEAPARALKLLRCLSYDAAAIQDAYRIAVRDDLMDAYPVRNGGTNFPKDLHFFGELISRKKIRIYVDFTPRNSTLLTNRWAPGNIQVEFLATTGELLQARLPDPDALSSLSIRSPERLPAIESPDFTPPVFLSASRKIAVPPATISPGNAVALLHQAWDDLQQKVGPNPVHCYLVCDNLNQPEDIARELAKLARKTPWAGASYLWRNDLPFDPAMMNQLSRERCGVGLLAIGGKTQTQLEAVATWAIFRSLVTAIKTARPALRKTASASCRLPPTC
jgi:hypothetical protein